MIYELEADSVTTTPPSDHPRQPPSHWNNDNSSVSPTASRHIIRLMCSFGGRILPRPHDHQLRYVGGDTRIVAISRSTSFSTLLSKLSKIVGSSFPSDQLTIKYQLPNEDLEALISLTSDEDVENMIDEYDRLSAFRTPRLRLFLFQSAADSSGAFGSVLEGSGSSKHQDWFIDALNGSGSTASSLLERGRSEASSIISEVPDYLFGFDNNSDEMPPARAAARQTNLTPEPRSLYEPGTTNLNPKLDVEIPVQTGYIPNPAWQFVAEPMPVYYVPGPMMPGGGMPVQPLPMPFPMVAHQAPVGYPQPVQGFVGNLIQGGPVYYGGTQMMGAAYEYPVAGEGQPPEFVTSGGLMRNSTVPPFYQPIQPAGTVPTGTGPPVPRGTSQ